MRTLLLMLLAVAGVEAQWRESSIIGTPGEHGKMPIGVYVQSDGVSRPMISIPPRRWVTIDLANGSHWTVNGDQVTFQPNLPKDIKAVFLSGIMAITYPTMTEYVGVCHLWANFRAPGSSLPGTLYQAQAIASVPGDGARSNVGVWVPVVDRKFEFFWSDQFPTFPAVTTASCWSVINLSVQAYVR